jgi:hypothetical protein
MLLTRVWVAGRIIKLNRPNVPVDREKFKCSKEASPPPLNKMTTRITRELEDYGDFLHEHDLRKSQTKNHRRRKLKRFNTCSSLYARALIASP